MEQSNKRQVLLLGNGINRAFDGISWSDILDKIKTQDHWQAKTLNEHGVPMPLQAILVTSDQVKDKIAAFKKDFYGRINNEEQKDILRKILSMGFDDILTTNYSYELEAALFDEDLVTDSRLKKLQASTCGKPEPRYAMHTYYNADFQNVHNRIWHIHGESRKPDSMILGHYWYSSQLAKLKSVSDKKRNAFVRAQKTGTDSAFNTWFDSFVLGDVYVLGFGLDFSEIDLWWLLNRKKREKAAHGTVYFYEMESERNYEKVELLRLLGVVPISFGMRESEGKFKDFYKKALSDIEQRMQLPAE